MHAITTHIYARTGLNFAEFCRALRECGAVGDALADQCQTVTDRLVQAQTVAAKRIGLVADTAALLRDDVYAYDMARAPQLSAQVADVASYVTEVSLLYTNAWFAVRAALALMRPDT